jgi:serine/threonine protein kinase
MAPEQIRGSPAVSHKTDLYALGAVLYQMLTGRPPFEGNSAIVMMHRHMNEPPTRPSEKIHEIPEALDKLIVRLMAKAPPDRPLDAAEVENVLSQFRDKESQWVVKKSLRVSLARRSIRTLLSRVQDQLRLGLWNRVLRGKPRHTARDPSPGPYVEDPLWDQELDG